MGCNFSISRPGSHWFATLAVIAGVAALSGCGETNGAAISSLAPQYQARRAQWLAFAAALPAPGTVANRPSPVTPPLVFNETNDAASNVEIVMADQLVSPETRADDTQGLDLGLSDMLLTCMQWTGPRNPMSPTAIRAREGARLRRQCTAALQKPYLMVLRPSVYVAAAAIDATRFTPGSVTMDVLLIDVASGALRSSFVVSAVTDPGVQYSYRRGGAQEYVQRRTSRYGSSTTRTTRYIAPEDPAQQLRAAAHSSLWTNARNVLAQTLRATGASITLRQ